MAKIETKIKNNVRKVIYTDLFIIVNIHHGICNYRFDTLDGTRKGAWHHLNPRETPRALRERGWKCVKTKMTLEFKNLLMDPKPLT